MARTYTAKCSSRFREGWHVEYDIVTDRRGQRVRGEMFSDGVLQRENFNVKLSGDRFKVDLGTGSGIALAFRHAEVS